MKFKILLISVFLLLGAQAANAQLFGWHGSVTFSSGTSTFTVFVSGPTYWACEMDRSNVKALFSPPVYTVTAESPCVPLVINPEIFILPEYEIPIPRPECLSCPYLRKDFLEHIYPNDFEKVIQLMDKYGIQKYNRALDELNTQFDLEGFGQEMYLLEQEINQKQYR